MTCETCKFFSGDKGQCRRNPPNFKSPADRRGYWPLVLVDDWCGEYKPSLKQEVKELAEALL